MFGAISRRVAFPRTQIARAFSTSPASHYQERMSQYYHNVLRDDLMILNYVPESVRQRQEAAEEIRAKEIEENPTGTPPNPVRKHQVRRPSPKVPVPTAHNSPYIKKITVHIRCREALNNKHNLLSPLMALQLITGKKAVHVSAKKDAAGWKLRKGMPIGAKVDLQGDAMYGFLDKLVELVLPRMKEYKGLSMRSGDGKGNFTMGFDTNVLGLFPEMEVVYDMFPLITGFFVNIETSAVRNPPGRLLLSGLGLPFVHARKPKSEAFEL